MTARRAPARRKAAPVPASEPVPDMASSQRWVWYLLSLFVPYLGMLVALFLYDRDDREVRRVGRNCLLISFIAWVVLPLALGFLILLVTLVSMAGWIGDLMGQGN